jgi:hypothetical protein
MTLSIPVMSAVMKSVACFNAKLSVVTQSVVMLKVILLRVVAPFLGICRLIVRPERNKNQIELKKGFDASMTKI